MSAVHKPDFAGHRQSNFAQALLDPELPCPPGLTTWNDADPSLRFRIYRNNVIRSLMNALVDTFPVCQSLLGEDFFDDVARSFVLREPPRSATLTYYGAAFPDFLATYKSDDIAIYLADVARLEMLYVDSYHAADAEPISLETLEKLRQNEDQLANAVFTLHPSLKIFSSRYPVMSVWAAYQAQTDMSAIDTRLSEDVMVLRQGLQVRITRLTPGSFVFIEALLAKKTLQEAQKKTLAHCADFNLAHAMAVLIQSQALVSYNTITS